MTTIARTFPARTADAKMVNHAAFETFYGRHARYVAGVVTRILGADSEVDDVVQETFADAYRDLLTLSDVRSERGWLVTVAVRRARRLLGRRRRRELFAFWTRSTSASTSDPGVREPVDDLYDALSRLHADVRIPWALHRIEEMNLDEVAFACEISVATAKRRIADAEDKLERRLGGAPLALQAAPRSTSRSKLETP